MKNRKLYLNFTAMLVIVILLAYITKLWLIMDGYY